MPEYNKPFRTQTELLEQLKRRGLLIQDEREAIAWLGKVNYYRMTGYLYPFRQFSTETSGERAQRADNFVQDASFEIVRDLYDFDRRLRLHVLDAVERIEIAVRTAVTDALGQHDRFAYENQSLLRPQFFSTKKGRPSEYDEWKKKFQDNVKASSDDFVGHFREKYDSRFPIWVAVELWDFGMLSKFYERLKDPHRYKIALSFGADHRKCFPSWLRSINFLRNVSAHHGRLWNRNLVQQVSVPDIPTLEGLQHLHFSPKIRTRVYSTLAVMQFLMEQVSPASKWKERLFAIMETLPKHNVISPKDMGFPDEYRKLPIWI